MDGLRTHKDKSGVTYEASFIFLFSKIKPELTFFEITDEKIHFKIYLD